jgi:peptidoglycan/LPS O-acetylase OafA/YrhL
VAVIWRVLESVHGHLGALAVVALVHPAILLRRGLPLSRGARWAVALSTATTLAAFGLGVGIYEQYRATVKRDVFAASRTVGFLFETKEHVGYAVAALALGACVAALVAPPQAVAVRRAAAAAYAIGAVLCLVVAGLGTFVASVAGFP